MRTAWTTDRGPDPALRYRFAADQPAAVAVAVVGGVDVIVTLVSGHEDFDCPLGTLHERRCPESGLRIWDRATGALVRAVPEAEICDNSVEPGTLVTVSVHGRALAVVQDWARPPKVVDLETGRRVGTVAGHEDAVDVQGFATVGPVDGPALVTAGRDGILRVTGLATGRTTTVDTGERLNAGDGTVSRWRQADGIPQPDLGRLPSRVNAVAAFTDPWGRHVLAVGGEFHDAPDPTLYHWIDGVPQPPVTLDHNRQVDVVATWLIDGEAAVLTAGKGDGNVHIGRLAAGRPLWTVEHTYPPYGVAVGAWAGRPAVAVNWMFGPFVVWDLVGRSPIPTPAAANVEPGEAPHAWIDTGTGPAMVTVHDARVRVHALLTGAVTDLQPDHDEPVTALAVTTDRGTAAVAIARTDRTVSVIDPVTNHEAAHVTLLYAATAMTFAPGGLLAIAYRNHIRCVRVG